MQIVSQAYADSMKAPLRNRGYIEVSFGLFNDEAQADASVVESDDPVIYYSNDSEIFTSGTEGVIYGTLEGDFCKVDGSMLFPPREATSIQRYNTGLVSRDLVSSGTIDVDISFSSPFSWYGLTILFGENYPVDFDIVAGGVTTQIRGNNAAQVRIDQAFSNVNGLEISFITMRHPDTRARIYNIRFGIGLVYTNDQVLGSTLEQRVSPISEFVPQYDFSVKLRNENRYFDIENPNTVFNYFDTDQMLSVRYGYELDNGRIEWLPAQSLFCSSWEADNFSATIRAQDCLRNLNADYYKGKYDSNYRSFYDLAEDVLASAGITEYSLYFGLRNKTTPLPIPRVSHKEALQLIANACCCALSFTRRGGVVIEPVETASENFKIEYMDMTSYPVTRKLQSVRDVVVHYQIWFQSSNIAEELMFNESITVSAGETRTFLFTDPLFAYRVPLSSASVVDSGAYFITISFAAAGTYTLNIYAKRFRIVNTSYNEHVASAGDVVDWKNPLVGDIIVAHPLARWLKDYYRSTVEYEYDMRGNPELDVLDIIGQQNDFVPNLKVRVTESKFRFDQAFSGHIVARREGV